MNAYQKVIVAKDDYGIRPAGSPDRCFYCDQKVGTYHKDECVTIEKTVKMRYIFEIDVKVPQTWDKYNIEFHRNESSWCADNALSELAGTAEKIGCLCSVFKAELIEEVL